MDKIRETIERRLSEIGIGAVAAAERAGLERGYIRDFLKGRKRTFNQDKLQKLADALECDILDLVGSPPPIHEKKSNSSARQKWNQIFESASPIEQKKMLNFLEFWILKNRKD